VIPARALLALLLAALLPAACASPSPSGPSARSAAAAPATAGPGRAAPLTAEPASQGAVDAHQPRAALPDPQVKAAPRSTSGQQVQASSRATSGTQVQAASPAPPAGAQAGATPRPELPPLPGTAGDPGTSITPEEISEHIEVLASDLFEGREAGTRGEERASAYIIGVLEEHPRLRPAGADGLWLQPFPIMLHGEPAVAHNICALLPGTDPHLAHETIVAGAHYDHVGYGASDNALDGRGAIHNGADDNASGSATLLDLATSLAESGWQPRRSILFQWYSAEELGLLGSLHWCEEPLRPLEDTVFMLNMDMVGRLVADTLLVGGTGTSPGFADLARAACERSGLVMLDDPPGSAPSDNTSFYDRRVPVLFLFTGLHDDYHAAGDDAAKINAAGAARIGDVAASLLLALDAQDERPPFRASPGNALMFRPHAYTGVTFAVTADVAPPGPVKVTVVIPGSPAEAAGLRADDIIVSLDGAPLPGAPGFGGPAPDAPPAGTPMSGVPLPDGPRPGAARPGGLPGDAVAEAPRAVATPTEAEVREHALALLEARLKRLDPELSPIVLGVVREGAVELVTLQPVVR
jgi:hypothetical protein